MNFMAHEGHNADVLKLVDAGMFLAHQPRVKGCFVLAAHQPTQESPHTGQGSRRGQSSMRTLQPDH